jgi:protein LSM14
MPIPISIPRPTIQQSPPPSTAPQIVDTAKATTAADVQSLAKNLSETKITSTSNVPGAGGYLIQPTRRRQFGGAAAANQRNMEQDYDFESANAKFNKEDVAKEVAAAHTTTTTATNGTDETSPSPGPSAAQLASALNDEKFYDKKSSFFDNISCENKDRTAARQASQDGLANPNSWKRGEERKLNMETFGQASIDYGGGRYGRGGGYRGGRGGGGGYRGGRGGGGGGYYGGRGRGGASQNPWRGGPRANGQNSSSETTQSA